MECALSSLVSVRGLLIVFPDREVTVRKGADDGTSTSSPTAAGVVSNQLLGQLDPEGLGVSKLAGAGVVLCQDKSICYCHIEQKIKNVFIKFSAFCPAAIISSELIPTVYSSHVLIVRDNTLWTRDRDP